MNQYKRKYQLIWIQQIKVRQESQQQGEIQILTSNSIIKKYIGTYSFSKEYQSTITFNIKLRMPSNFKQQFQDSQANFSQMQQSKSYSNQNTEQGYPIQLIRFKQNSKTIEVDQKALDLIAQCDLPVGFVTFVGKYRIGKSCLLNRLLGLSGQGFKVSNKTKQCTKGIWMWSKPFYSDEHQCYLFFMDTQGTQALSKQAETDVKLFTLSCLISTYMVYNSVGSIVESSIQDLNLVSTLGKNILISEEMSTRENQEELYKYMPKFLWLLRDFSLELGYKTPKDYLEYCLKPDSESNSKYNNSFGDGKTIRNQITKVFKQRDCFTLIRPVEEQSDIQRLNELPDHALRRNFLQQVRQLKAKIFKNAEPKCYQGQALLGGAMSSMIETFVQAINHGGVPQIKSAWEQVAEDEGAFAYNRALERFNQLYAQNFLQDDPFAPDVLHDILSNMKQQSLEEFNRCLTHPNEPCHARLKQYMKAKEKNIIEVNKQLTEVRNVELLKDLSMPLMKRLETGAYKGKKKNLTKDIDDLVKSYNMKALGQTKGDIISEFLTTLNPILISLGEQQASKQNQKQSKLSAQALQQFQNRQKLLEQQLTTMKNQLDSKETMLKKREKELKDANEEIKKKSTKGCCEIM